jgi:hypothetical protein
MSIVGLTILRAFALIFKVSTHPHQPCHVPVTLPREICTECFERLVSNILQGDKMLHFLSFVNIFIFVPLIEG